jgi:hypothetical protein
MHWEYLLYQIIETVMRMKVIEYNEYNSFATRDVDIAEKKFSAVIGVFKRRFTKELYRWLEIVFKFQMTSFTLNTVSHITTMSYLNVELEFPTSMCQNLYYRTAQYNLNRTSDPCIETQQSI